jgi:hypothetical protein
MSAATSAAETMVLDAADGAVPGCWAKATDETNTNVRPAITARIRILQFAPL